VAAEYSEHQKRTATAGKITMNRWKIVDSYIRLHLIPYVGKIQITHVTETMWEDYPIWRKQNNAEKKKKTRPGFKPPKDLPPQGAQDDAPHPRAKDGTIRQEMMTFRAIMNFAAKKKYIGKAQVPEGDLPLDEARREQFNPEEYRRLHTFARYHWIEAAKSDWNRWYRNMAYDFMLVMANTGMRTMEASNLRWCDIEARADKQGRQFVCLNVRGKGKFRELIAAQNVTTYLERIKSISKATKPEDFVFTTHAGKPASTLYASLIESLLTQSNLLYSSSGSRRSTYCFRHTYATFRLLAGVDIYFLAKQMGTSVQMIEDYYGHITPSKSAERILEGMPEWELALDGSGEPPPA
jgi:integrase